MCNRQPPLIIITNRCLPIYSMNYYILWVLFCFFLECINERKSGWMEINLFRKEDVLEKLVYEIGSVTKARHICYSMIDTCVLPGGRGSFFFVLRDYITWCFIDNIIFVKATTWPVSPSHPYKHICMLYVRRIFYQ